MATWVSYSSVQSGYSSSCYYYIAGGYGTVSRSGNTVSFSFGARVQRWTSSWTSNGHAFRYPNSSSGTQYHARKGSGSKGTWYYASSTSAGSYTSEKTPWSYSGTVSGTGSGNISITVGWNDDWTTPAVSYGGWNSYTFSVPYPALPSYSFNMNILNPDGSEPYSTGEAGSVERSINGGTYERKYNEDASSYVTGTTIAYRNFTPGTGRYLSSVSGVSPTDTTGPWSVTINGDTSVNFYTAWNTYYRDINAWNPDKSAQSGLIFDYYIYNRDGTLVNSYTNQTNEVANTVTREYGYTGKINNIRSNVTGAHYSSNNVTGTAASEFTWTYNNGNAIELYTAWDNHTMTLWPGSGTYNGSSSNYQITNTYPSSSTIGFPTAPTGHVFAGYRGSSGLLSGITSGDAIFESGTGGMGVYDNTGSGLITFTREQNNSVPNVSMGSSGVGYQVKITKAAGSTSPASGGFYLSTQSAANKVFRHIIWAKIPVGYTISDHRNAIGDGGYSTWLTEQKGTGDWYRYVYEVHCGASGSFSNFGHVALNATDGDNSKAVTWYVCATQITDITNNPTVRFTSDHSIECFYAPKKSTITYNANGGSGAPGSHTYTYASSGTTNLSSTKPTRTGYTFLGWSLSSTATSASYSAGQSWNLNNQGDYTLYAVWQINNYTITIRRTTGIADITSPAWGWTDNYKTGTAQYGSSFRVNASIQSGYHWVNWTGTFTTTTQDYTFTVDAKNYDITANAAPNTYTVVYNANGGTGTTASSSHTYNAAKALTKNGFTKAGYNFIGWSTSSTATTATYTDQQSVTNLTATNNGTVTLYAVWELAQATLQTKVNGAWVQGAAYVKVNGAWVSGKQVYVKVNGAWVLSGGTSKITFKIDGTTYEADAGMTWSQWCSSSYNTIGATVWTSSDNRIEYTTSTTAYYVCYAEGYPNMPKGSEQIRDGYTYTTFKEPLAPDM